MKYISVSIAVLFFGILLPATGCQAQSCGDELMEGEDGRQTQLRTNEQGESAMYPVQKDDHTWKKELTSEEFRVLREKGTEVAFTGKYYKHDDDGVYRCAGCGAELFRSDEKYNSGSGWPSFYAPASESNVVIQKDYSHGMVREEVLCAQCGGHLGHVFEDGPQPTGLRYCINSVSLEFEKEKENE